MSKTPIQFVPREGQADYVTFRYSAEGYAWADIGRHGGQQFINRGNIRAGYKDQRSNGGYWVPLGTGSFTAGWNKVQVNRNTTAGANVIADAIRVR
jgi:hypothetical protein